MSTRADFLFELGTEELPPKALENLARTFHAQMVKHLADAELDFTASHWYATPRRLSVLFEQLLCQQPSREQVKLGPALSAAFNKQGQPTPAAIGFARANGVTVEALEQIESDRGPRLGLRLTTRAVNSAELLPTMIQHSLKNLPIPKMMRWGARREEFVRPVKWILALLGQQVVPMELFGQHSANTTRGHRFHAPEPLTITSPAEYINTLRQNGFVIADYAERRALIVAQAQAAITDGEVIIHSALLDEVCGLVEWPCAMVGQFESEFLQVPQEALISSMQAHQKYFPVRDPKGALSNRFVTISNLESRCPQSVIAGNEKVIRPRLADARFFFETDQKQSLESRRSSLSSVLFQHQLGTLADKSARVVKLARHIAPAFGAEVEQTVRAAELGKCDLMTDMVGEFPHLQGVMGRYYATHDGESSTVARAIDEQYMPRFSGDQLPSTAEGAALAVAERLDTLVGLFGIGQPPKGAKDPFALRRAALGVLRILMQREVSLELSTLVEQALAGFDSGTLTEAGTRRAVEDFLFQRFHAWYQEREVDTHVIQAVMAKRPGVVVDFDRRIRAVAHFKDLDEAAALASAHKRVSNILTKEGVRDGILPFTPTLLQEPAEKALAAAVDTVCIRIEPLFAQADYQAAMVALAALREPVDTFFEQVMVLAEDPALRHNRLALLQRLQRLFVQVADISLLPG